MYERRAAESPCAPTARSSAGQLSDRANGIRPEVCSRRPVEYENVERRMKARNRRRLAESWWTQMRKGRERDESRLARVAGRNDRPNINGARRTCISWRRLVRTAPFTYRMTDEPRRI